MKMYFKGGKGITEPVDMDGKPITIGSILSNDYGDHEKYNIQVKPDAHTKPFYEVKWNEKGFYYAESIEICTASVLEKDARFYLHDFRFKYCKLLK